MGRNTIAGSVLARVKEGGAAAVSERGAKGDPRVLTARFAEVRGRWFRDGVDAAIELGRILRDGKKTLGAGYGRWLAEDLHVEQQTASNYLRLAELARHEPASVERFKDLGLAKLYKIARLPPEARPHILHHPGVRQLTDGEFHTLTARYLKPSRKVSGNMKANGLRGKARAALEWLRRAPPAKIDDPAMKSALKQDLLDLSRAAREAAERVK